MSVDLLAVVSSMVMEKLRATCRTVVGKRDLNRSAFWHNTSGAFGNLAYAILIVYTKNDVATMCCSATIPYELCLSNPDFERLLGLFVADLCQTYDRPEREYD